MQDTDTIIEDTDIADDFLHDDGETFIWREHYFWNEQSPKTQIYIPPSVRNLKCDITLFQHLSDDLVFPEIKKLTVDMYSYKNHRIPGNILPSITHLKFEYFNSLLHSHIVPSSVIHLSFDENFNKPLCKNTIPFVKHISVSRNFRSEIDLDTKTKITCQYKNYRHFIQNQFQHIVVEIDNISDMDNRKINRLIKCGYLEYDENIYYITNKIKNNTNRLTLKMDITQCKSARKV